MRRFYVVPKSVWQEPIELFGHKDVPRFTLFHPQTGSHYIDLEDGYILLSADFATEWAEEEWHSHTEVARLPHPTLEGHVKIADLVRDPQWAHKQFKPHHFEKLKALGVDETHTVWDLHQRAKAIHPLVRLSNVY